MKVDEGYREKVFAYGRNKTFTLAELGNEAGVYGAAALVLSDVE